MHDEEREREREKGCVVKTSRSALEKAASAAISTFVLVKLSNCDA
jgi:hypothetical protein